MTRSGWRALMPWLGVTLVALAVAVPYAFLSPNYLREDFVSLHNAARNGAFGAAGQSVALARPASGAVFAVIFGLLGGRPETTILLMAAVHAVNAVLLFALAKKVLPRRVALGVGVLWALLPTNSALTHWPSAAHIGMALALTLFSALVLWREPFAPWMGAVALAMVLASGLTYEAILPLALAVALIVPRVATGRYQWRFFGPVAALVGALALWHLSTTTKTDPSLVSAVNVIHGHFGSELITSPTIGRPLAVCVVCVIGLAIGKVVLPGFSVSLGHRVVVVGAALVALGTLPFIGFGQDIDYVMQGDRATVVSGIGTVLVLVGIGLLLARYPPLVVVLGSLLLVGMAATQVVNNRAYVRSSQQVGELLATARVQVRPDQRTVVAVTEGPLGCDGVEAINDDENLRTALEWFLDRDFEQTRIGRTGEPGTGLDSPGAIDLRSLPSLCRG